MKHCVTTLAVISVLSCCTRGAADVVAGVDWYIANAEVVLVVRAQTSAEDKVFPPPEKQRRLLVEEVLKGVTTHQYLLHPTDFLKPGQKAVVLVQHEFPTVRQGPQRPLTIWSLEGQSVRTGDVPPETIGRGAGADNEVPLAFIRNEIAARTPEQVDLARQVVETCLAPERTEELAKKDPSRAEYVRFINALRDLDRDAPTLAKLLESSDAKIRELAHKKLRELCSADLPSPVADDRKSLSAWSQAWNAWWHKNQPQLFWEEEKGRWRRLDKETASRRAWPEVPASMKLPEVAWPADLIEALEKKPAAFAPAFRRWLDAGVLRDRQLIEAEKLDSKLREQFHLTVGGYRAPAPRLAPDLVVGNGKLPALTLVKIVALTAADWHHDRFVAERQQAALQIQAASPDPEIVRRAAFWEPLDAYHRPTPGSAAFGKLGESREPASQKLLLALFLTGPSSSALDAGRTSLYAGNQLFRDGLLAHIKDKRDVAAEWAGRLLCQTGKTEAIPLLLEWFKDKDPKKRGLAAFNLCWLPNKDAVPALLAALDMERNDEVERQLVVAIAQVGDPRALKALLSASEMDYDRGTQIEIARGLARIRDPKALPALASISLNAKDEQLQTEAVRAFEYVFDPKTNRSPHGFWSGGGIEPERVRAGLLAIQKWKTERVKQ